MIRCLESKINKALAFSFLIFFISAITTPAIGAEEAGESKTAFIFRHVQDSHEWHLATIGHTHITIPLPVIIYERGYGLRFYMSSDFVNEHHEPVEKDGYLIDSHGHLSSSDTSRTFYDISITKDVTTLLLSVVLMFWVFITIARRYKNNPAGAPSGIQSALEPVILFVRNEIAIPSIGEKNYARFMPYLLSVFFFIWFNNMLGLLPGAANLSGNISVTLTLAIFTFVVTNLNGTKDYWRHIFNTPGVPWWLKIPIPLMPLVEFVGILTKPFSLMIRLFANITAGHIVIMSLIALIFIFETVYVGPVSVLFGIFMTFIELLVAFIQAFVFTLLSAIYFGLATAEHEHHHEEHKEKLKEVSA
ncbi:MAG: F0F1 ATP synthase subunit A [Cyclobacteriaceae bacterium]|nr:F0F1 ATP synthase subunit A [Cyclobacteriaceae bacterium]